MRKFKLVYNRKYGICLLILGLIVSQAGITKIRTVEAEEIKLQQAQQFQQQKLQYEFQVNDKIPSRSLNSIYIERDKTVNIYPQRPEYKLNLDERYQDLIYQLCLKNDISYEFVLSVLNYESKYNPKAENKNIDDSYDRGLCQLNSVFLSDYIKHGIQYCDLPKDVDFDVWNVEHNIRAGIGHLVYLRNEYKAMGLSGKEMFLALCNGWNLGMKGYRDYIRDTGRVNRYYDYEIKIRKDKLETSNTL